MARLSDGEGVRGHHDMRVVIADHPGAPDVLHPVTLPDPEPGPGQVRVAVEVAAITFIDTLIRAGSPVAPPATFPVILGNGVGGLIDRVGANVNPAWIGTRVVTTTGGTGGYASLALARATDLHRVPAPLRLPEATALLADGRTAVGLHQAAEIQPGETVVITAAAGGVGSILVQLTKACGAHVIALAGSTDKLDHARSLGADTTVNYRDHDWTSRLVHLAGTFWSTPATSASNTSGPLHRRADQPYRPSGPGSDHAQKRRSPGESCLSPGLFVGMTGFEPATP